MNGTSSLKKTSKSFQTDWSLSWIEALLLMGGGVMAVVLHRTLDSSLGLPGHHGIEWMAILIIGRASSRYRGAGTLTSIGASFASVLPFLSGENPFTWIYYLLPGPVMDLAFYYLPRYSNKLLVHDFTWRLRARDKADRSTQREPADWLACWFVPLRCCISLCQPSSLWNDRGVARRVDRAWHSPHVTKS